MNFKVGDRRCSLILAALILSSLSAHGLEISGSPDRIPAEIRMPLNLNAEPSDPLGSAMDFPLLSAGLGTVDAGPVEEKRDSPFFLNSSPRQSVSRGPVLSASVAMTAKKNMPAELSRLKGLASLRLGQAFDSSRSFFDGTAYNAGNSSQPQSVFENEEPIILEGHGERVRMAVSPNGLEVVTASWAGTANIWDANTGQPIRTLKGHDSGVTNIAFSPDGLRIVTASYDGIAEIWDANTGQLLRTLKGHSDALASAAFSPDGSQIVTASYDNTTKIWDAETGQLIRTLKGHSGWVWSAAFSPDGSKIVTASYDRTAKILNAKTGQLLRTLEGHSGWVWSAVFSPDGSKIVTASYDRTAKIWDTETGQLIKTLEGHSDWVNSAAFSPDGSKIITASNDKTAKIWDAETGELLRTWEGNGDQIFNATFSPDGSKIITASSDGTIRIWPMKPSAKQIENLKREVELTPAPENTPVHDDFTIPGWKAAINP